MSGNEIDLGVLRQPTIVYFGPGRRALIPQLVSAVGRRVLVCTDERMAGTGAFTELTAALADDGLTVSVYPKVEPELPRENLVDLMSTLGDTEQDVVVGLGGGSCLDFAKVAAVLLARGGDVRDLYGENLVAGPGLPVICVPTTAGTGAEATCISVVYDADKRMKLGVASAYLEPYAAVIDPELTLTCPPALTAATGADALSHLVESFTARTKNPTTEQIRRHLYVGKNLLSDLYARNGLMLLGSSLEKVAASTRRPAGAVGDDARRVLRRDGDLHRRYGRRARHPVADRRDHRHPAWARGRRAAALHHALQPAGAAGRDAPRSAACSAPARTAPTSSGRRARASSASRRSSAPSASRSICATSGWSRRVRVRRHAVHARDPATRQQPARPHLRRRPRDPPSWLPRRPRLDGVLMRPVAVVGTGSIGVAFGIVFASAGRYVRMWDPVADSLDRARQEVADRLRMLASHGLIREPAEDVAARITFHDELEHAVWDVELVQECAPEDVDLKRELFELLGRHTPADTVLASSSSALVPSQYGAGLAPRTAFSGPIRATRPTCCGSSSLSDHPRPPTSSSASPPRYTPVPG